MSSDNSQKVLTLASGRKIDLATRAVVDDDAPAASLSSFTPVPANGLKLEDLGHDHQTITVVNAVFVYRSIGIPDNDICFALGCTMEQLTDVTSSDAYTSIQERMLSAYVRGQEASARGVLANHSTEAASILVQVMQRSKSEKNKLTAATNVLDRNGIRGQPGDMSSEGEGLVIKVVKDSKVNDSITIKIGQ